MVRVISLGWPSLVHFPWVVSLASDPLCWGKMYSRHLFFPTEDSNEVVTLETSALPTRYGG